MTTTARKLSALLRDAGIGPLEDVVADPIISGAEIDSRRITAGDIFCAIHGLKVDGNRFVPQAVELGAPAIVSDSSRPGWLDPAIAWVRVADSRLAAGLLSREIHGRPDLVMNVVGITGTNGKTTVSYLVQAIAAAAGLRAGRIGTVGHAFADIERSSTHTTPEAPDLYRLLAEMRDESIDLVSMEVSSHALSLNRVAGVRFDTAAFLNLGRDHLDFHDSEDDYFAAKARLFEALAAEQYAVLPADSPVGQRMRQLTSANVMTFGRSNEATIRIEQERCRLDGSSAVLQTPSGALPVRTFLPGRFNLDNVAAAAACALAVKLPPESIPAGVLAVERVPGRMERIDRGQPFTLLVDYAHTTEALQALLDWVRIMTAGDVRLVFGCGGDRDTEKRYGMGCVAAETADRIYLTSDNPRSEQPQEIIKQIIREWLRSQEDLTAVPP